MSPATDVTAREARLRALQKEDPEAFRAYVRRWNQRKFIAHGGGQEAILQSHARFRTLAAGRRWGKTKVAAHEIVKRAQKPNQMIWWIANTYKNVSRGYREVVNQLPPSWLAKPAPAYTSTTKILQLKNGTMIEFYSGGSPDSLAGEGVNFVVIDEAALIADSVWQQLIRPTLMDTGGEAFIISTPRGHNWFYDMWQLGQSGRPGYDSWRFRQTDNPYIPAEETESARLELPKIIFEQEIMAEFLAAGASIFGLGLERKGVIIDEIVEPRGEVFVGIDLAKKQDFTVITADREDGLPCYFERIQDMDWPTQQKRIGYAIEELEQQPGVESVRAIVDSTGLGDVVYDNLIAAGVDVIPFDFNGGRKEQAARLLAADMEHGKATILVDMKEEFGHYEFTLTPNGHYKFSAPEGKHDDMVSAKMLAHWARVHEGGDALEIVTIDRDDPAAEARLRETILIPTRPEAPDSALEIMERPEAWDNGALEYIPIGSAHPGGRGFFGG